MRAYAKSKRERGVQPRTRPTAAFGRDCTTPRKRRTFTAEVTLGGYIQLHDGQRFAAPSPAPKACVGGEINGWWQWQVERTGQLLEELRDSRVDYTGDSRAWTFLDPNARQWMDGCQCTTYYVILTMEARWTAEDLCR